MEIPRYIVLKSNCNHKYLSFIKEDDAHGFLKFYGEKVVSPYTKYEVQTANSGTGLLNIRSCYNNKYWVRSSEDQYWVVAGADEPDEDQYNWSCTLFEPVYNEVDRTMVRFRHVQLNRYACLYKAEDVYDSCLFVRSETPNSNQLYEYTIIDWESQLILPKHIAFKGHNDEEYLRACMFKRHRYLQFISSNDEDPRVWNEIFTNEDDGSIRIKSHKSGKFWRRNPRRIEYGWRRSNWIWADSDDNSNEDSNTLFRPIKIDERTIALLNLGNDRYCANLTRGDRFCLNAAVTEISRAAKLEVKELVSSRSIYDVNYHLKYARIYNRIVSMDSQDATNTTQGTSNMELTFKHNDKRSNTWSDNMSLKMGVETSITARAPFIVDGNIKFLTEFTSTYTWGETRETTETVESKYTITIQPGYRMKVRQLASKGSCNIPFSYTRRDTYKNGKTSTVRMDDGVFTGVNSFNFHYHTEEEKL